MDNWITGKRTQNDARNVSVTYRALIQDLKWRDTGGARPVSVVNFGRVSAGGRLKRRAGAAWHVGPFARRQE